MSFKVRITKDEMAEFKYEVKERYGKLSQKGDVSMELRLVSYNGNEAKYDIRLWKVDERGERMFKGITLSREELRTLKEILTEMEI